jgi:dihydrofolate reductase
MYEVLVAWESIDVAEQPPVIKDFAEIWRTTDKIVYSTTLATASSARTRVERIFHPDAIRRIKASAERDISVAGPNLAAHAIRAGLVDEYHLFVNPIAVGGGTSYLPHDTRVELELLDQRRFRSGVVFLRYRGR